VKITEEPAAITVSGKEFRYVFDRSTGELGSMSARGTELLQSGPELDTWRAPISNETFNWAPPEANQWRAVGLERQATRTDEVTVHPEADGSATVRVTGTVAAPDRPDAWFAQSMTYRVDAAGTIRLRHEVSPRDAIRGLPYLPRVGVSLAVPDRFQKFAWYGRGPEESYSDRKDGTPFGVFSSTVDGQYVDYLHPQDYGNHTDTRWTLLTDGRSGGLLVSGASDVSVTPYDDLDRAAYPFQRKRNAGWFTLHAAHAASGVGDTPNPTLPQYRVSSTQDYQYELTLRPLTRDEVRAGRPRG
jgi:beta-galactosidase